MLFCVAFSIEWGQTTWKLVVLCKGKSDWTTPVGRLEAAMFTFIFAGLDEGDLGWARGEVGGHRVAVRAWGQTPLSGAAALSVPVPPPAQPFAPAAPPARGSTPAVGAPAAPCLVNLLFVTVIVLVVLRHGLAITRAPHRDLHLPLSPDGLDRFLATFFISNTSLKHSLMDFSAK